MVCETKPDEVETLVIIGKQKTRYKMLLDHNCTIKQLDEKLQNLQFTSQPNFEIKICLVDDDPHVDYEVSPGTVQDLYNLDWSTDLKTLKKDLQINNTNGFEYSFYLQTVPDDEHLKSKRNGTDTKRIVYKTKLNICEDTNSTNDDRDTMNDVDIQNHVDITDYTNKKDIFCTTFPDYSVKKQDSSIDSDDKEPLTKVNSRGENAGDDIKRLPRGLVNQAMTCYLNSLLQALYMTPEFRNALYKWEYVESPDNDETMSIPFQLQRLFLNLQTSEKMSVETTSLTKSFGWDSSEAWQQHDIQELCRVMFDALEQKFKNTEQANLINQLYEGKMIDYVKCLECNTEKTREDTFLDIPLPVRPFNSNEAYNSIEDALKAFVKYELLEGNNQYHCEKCDKKCDAHKGLKFKKFPYVVTLHLKRFDFDCHSFHRIKLNDRVTFPETLDLNPFIDSADTLSGQENNCQENNTKLDNGVLPDECSPCDGNSVENNHGNDEPNNDEGIETNDNCIAMEPKGPYVYELFAIMIHSGSASGGHYYAYIKDFTTQQWYCVNDQSVTLITPKDIKNTYGGGPARTTYYSSAYNTSTNAYMLMYRQIDPKINAVPMQEEDFPEHLKKLLPKLKEENSNSYRITHQMSVFCLDPKTNMLVRTKVSFRKGTTWGDVVAQANTDFGFYRGDTSLIKVFEYQGSTKSKISSPLCHQSLVDMSVPSVIIELPPSQETMKCELSILKLNVDEEIAVRPMETRQVNQNVTIGELKMQLSENSWDWTPSEMVIAKKSNEDFEVLKDDTVLSQLMWDLSFYVGNRLDPNPSITDFSTSKFCALCRTYSKLIYIQVQVPITDKGLLDALDIPSLREPSTPTKNSEIDYTEVLNDLPQESKSTLKEPEITNSEPCNTLQLSEIEDRNTPEQSNSEDSSQSDSDRTLVGDPVENNEDEDTELRVYQSLKVKSNPDENFEYDTYGLWIAQVPDIEGKLKKYLEPFMGISSKHFEVKNICAADAFPAQYQVYSVSLDRKLQSTEMKCKIINLNNSFDVEQTYDSTKLEVVINKSRHVRDLKKKILRLMNAKHPYRYKSCKLWLIYSYHKDDRDIFMFDNERVMVYFQEFLRLARDTKFYQTKELRLAVKPLYDNKTIEVAVYLESNYEDRRNHSTNLKNKLDYDQEKNAVPIFVRRFYPSNQKYDDVEIVWVDPSMKNFALDISKRSRIPLQSLEFVNYSSLEQQIKFSGLTFAKNLYHWKELMYKSRDSLCWSTTVSELPHSIKDVIIYRDDREEYPSDMIREDCEIYPGRLKQRIQMKERDDYRNRVDYTDKDIRIRSGIRSSMSRPEKGIKIQVSPNK